MPSRSPIVFEPRKAPVQARSAASVEAILEATIQVLQSVGKARLTTTAVAMRAGVSVGTLYQYFPNKSSLLQAVLRAHLAKVADLTEAACQRASGGSVPQAAAAIARTFLQAKMSNMAASKALYSVSEDVGGMEIAQENSQRTIRALTALLRSLPIRLSDPPEMIASILLGTLAGVSRRILESGSAIEQFEAYQQQLTALLCSYLQSLCVVA